MQITVLSVSKTQHMTKANKPYFQLEVAYKGEDGQVKGKKLMPFGSSKPAFDALVSAQTGEAWNVTLVKEGEYWSWTFASKSDGSAPQAVSTDTPQRTPAGKVTGSNYPTNEERQATQVYIVRQSSIANAVNLKGNKASVAEVIDTAKQFEAYVFSKEETTAPAAKPVYGDNLHMEDDIPL